MRDLEQQRVLDAVLVSAVGGERPPVRLGRFEIIDRIGTGGMSVVYSARDPKLQRKVALKIVQVDEGRGPAEKLRQRTLREGRALARLAHPNIVAVYDAGEEDGYVYLAVELVEGDTLGSWIEKAKPGVEQVIDALLQAGEGLAAAHAEGWVHRDVKPHNILIDSHTTARVADFGLAQSESVRAREPAGEASPQLRDVRVTQTGAVLGTPAYMAPEQWLGRATDARTDQFGLCATFFEAICGVRPFQGTDPTSLRERILAAQVTDPPAGAAMPAWLHEILLRGMRADPDDRYATLLELLADIRSHRQSVAQTGAALTQLARLRRLAEEERGRFAPLALECRTALQAALAAWPENADALAGREELDALWVERELRGGNVETVEALLHRLPGEERLEARLEELRALEQHQARRMQRLEQFEHDTNMNLHDRFKVYSSIVTAVAWSAVIGLFAYLQTRGLEVGNVHLTAVFGITLVFGLLSNLLFPAHSASRLNVKISQISLLGLGSHTALFTLAVVIDLSVYEAFAMVHLVTAVYWAVVAIAVDRRVVGVVPVTLIGVAVTLLWPEQAMAIGAAVSGLYLLVLAAGYSRYVSESDR